MEKMKIAVTGAAGRMGRELIRAVHAQESCVLSGAIEQPGSLALGQDAGLLAGLGAFLGHLFPAWLGFKGGKGVATCIGVLLGVYWPAAVFFCLVWLTTGGGATPASTATPPWSA